MMQKNALYSQTKMPKIMADLIHAVSEGRK